ncbi:phage tail tape measure protein [Salmonella enterica subsp. enterica serovar Montevideo]|nr:phage tail tape measure protein [Salmonella enterica subsp. enterica serovar Montevideo]
MARNLQLALSLQAKDGASKVLRQAMQDILKQTKTTQKASDEQAKSQQQNTSSAIRASRSLQDEYRRASSARSTLGIRAEREIQREIQQTMAAYNRLTRSGSLSAREQSRAFRGMSERVRELRTELSGVSNTMTRLRGLKPIVSTVGAVAGGVAAAGAVLSQPVSNQMTYQQRLAMMANTAYAEQGLQGRRAGMKDMDSLIRSSVRSGGGTKESAADTLDTMLASGAVSMDSAKIMLPVLQRFSTATGASSTDLARIAIRLKQTFDIKDEDIGKALNMAISAGQGGSFELPDMAKWLPQQLAAASNTGMKGLDDFGVLLGLNQAAAITAGNSDEAGNNVVNLLSKITSQDAANAAARIKLNGKNGIDLPGSIAKAQGKGINSLDAFVGVIDKVVENNPAYKKLDAQLKTAKGADRQRIMESQAKILEGSSVGKMVADRQALMALIGYRSNRGYAKDIQADANKQRYLSDGETAGDLNFSLMSEQAAFKTNKLKNEKDFAEMNSVQPLSNALGDISDKLSKYAEEYPGLTVAISDATLGIKSMTAAAIAFAGLNFLTGGGIKLPGGAGGGGSGGVLGRTWEAIKGNGGSVGGRLLGKILAPVALYQGAQDAPLVHVERGDADARARLKADNYSSSEARMLDAVKARPGLMDAVDEIKSWWSSPATIGQANPATTGVPAYLLPQQQKQPPLVITTKVMLDDREIAQAVNNVNGEQANRGSTGGPQ